MFRASPWISFRPDTHQESQIDDDVDMDAPQISTLREEETPPPQPATAKRVRKLKLVVKEKPPASPASSAVRTQGTEDDVDEDEDEEDQLIDDDDDEGASVPPPVETPSPVKRKQAAKRKPRKSEKQATQEDASEKAPREKGKVAHEEVEDSKPPEPVVPLSAVPPALSPVKGGRKRAPRKAPANPRPKKAPKLAKQVIPTMPPAEDTGTISDAAFTGTAASSPVTAQIDVGSPEPEVEPIQLPPATVPLPEDTNLENVPLPVYPLPNKPFAVQHPPKIGTGLAPMIPLDRSGKKVRRWRVANREIRGIAGGRWFARCWVGEKESEYASAVHARADGEGRMLGAGASMALPKLVSASISAPPLGRGSGKGKSKGSVVTPSAGSSRSGSAAPENNAVRVPTKMRTIVSAAPPEPDVAGDVEMAPAIPP